MRHLKESERQRAFETARKWAAGKEPVFKERSETPSKYPWQVTGIVLLLCIVLLVAAFIPSALRLYRAGSEEFCRAPLTSDAPECSIVGYATILLAETGSLVFILALSVVESKTIVNIRGVSINAVTTLLWASAVTSVLVAVVGNAHVGRPWERQLLFDYLIVFVPPALVLTVGYILKDFLLEMLRSRSEHNQRFAERKVVWEQTLEDPELSPQWLRFYSRALKEALQSANGREREEMENLSRMQWEQLILYEMHESSWSVDPNRAKEAVTIVAPADKELSVANLIADGNMWQNANGTWSACLPGTDQVIRDDYKSANYAKMAIEARLRTLNRNGG